MSTIFHVVLRIRNGDAYEIPVEADTREQAEAEALEWLGIDRNSVTVCVQPDGLYHVFDTHPRFSTLIAAFDDEADLAAFLQLDLGEVRWAIENCAEIETDTHRVEVRDVA